MIDAPSPPDDTAPEAIDWDFADRVARRVAGHEALERSYLARALHRDFDDVTIEAEGLVADHTGLRSLAGPARALVLDRPSWASANLVSFRRMLRPVTDRMAARMVGQPDGRSGPQARRRRARDARRLPGPAGARPVRPAGAG